MGAKKDVTQDCPICGANDDRRARETAQGADDEAHSHSGVRSQNCGEKWELLEEPLPPVQPLGWSPLW